MTKQYGNWYAHEITKGVWVAKRNWSDKGTKKTGFSLAKKNDATVKVCYSKDRIDKFLRTLKNESR